MTTAIKTRLLIALALLTLLLAVNGRLYWHEVRFSYAVNRFSLGEVLHGGFNPHQVGAEIDEVSSAGFYRTKVLHLASLKSLFSIVAPDRGGLELAMTLSLVLVGLTAVVTRQIFRRAFDNDVLADLGLISFLLTPVVPYMAGKLLSEVPALFFAALAVLAGQRGLAAQSGGGLRWAVGSGIFTLLAILSRLDLVILILAFWAAVLVTEASPRKLRALKMYGLSAAVAAFGYTAVMVATGAELRSFVQYFAEFTGTGAKSPLMSLVGIATFGGCMHIAAVLGLWSERKNAKLFFLLWLIMSAGPMLAVSSRYMIEPRYLIHAVIPFAGLAALGLEVFARRFAIGARSAMAMAVVAILVNWVVIRVMPYEVNRPQILAAVQQILVREPNAAILTPWAYTDFHFLKMMRPDVPIYNVHGDLPAGNQDSLDASWQKRSMDWYGDSFLNSPARLRALLQERPVYYFGWHKYPPIETVKDWLHTLGLSGLSGTVEALPSQDHLHQSWVWRSGKYELAEEGRSGQYVYYRVTIQGIDERTTQSLTVTRPLLANQLTNPEIPRPDPDGS